MLVTAATGIYCLAGFQITAQKILHMVDNWYLNDLHEYNNDSLYLNCGTYMYLPLYAICVCYGFASIICTCATPQVQSLRQNHIVTIWLVMVYMMIRPFRIHFATPQVQFFMQSHSMNISHVMVKRMMRPFRIPTIVIFWVFIIFEYCQCWRWVCVERRENKVSHS